MTLILRELRASTKAGAVQSVLAGPGAVAIWSAVPVGETFTSEHNLRRPGESGGGYGVLLEGFERDLRVRLDPGRQVVEVLGAGTGTFTSRLPAGYDHAALHCVRLELDVGVLTVSLDGRRLVEARWTGAPVAHLGYFTESSVLELGHTAVTHDVERLRSRTAVKPVPGRFGAALTRWPGERVSAAGHVPWERLVVRPGERVDYDLLIAEPGEHGIFLTGDFAHETEVALTLGNETTLLAATSDTAVRAWRGPLPAGPVPLGVTVITGQATLDLISVLKVDQGSSPTTVEGALVGAGKTVLAGAGWYDYSVDAMLEVEVAAAGGHGDLLLRASHLADGFEGNDPVLGTEFLLGYSIQLHRDAVVLARHDYDTTVVIRKPAALDLRVPHRVRASVSGSLLRVLVDDHISLEHQDELPHLVGGAGIRSLGANVDAHVIVTPM